MNNNTIYFHTANALWLISPELEKALELSPALNGFHSDEPVYEQHPDYRKWYDHFEFVRWFDD